MFKFGVSEGRQHRLKSCSYNEIGLVLLLLATEISVVYSGCVITPDGNGHVTIPETYSSISPEAFIECTALKSVAIPDSVTSIGSRAFAFCSSLEKVSIPVSVMSISSESFAYCSKLESATIGKNVTSIGERVFF